MALFLFKKLIDKKKTEKKLRALKYDNGNALTQTEMA